MKYVLTKCPICGSTSITKKKTIAKNGNELYEYYCEACDNTFSSEKTQEPQTQSLNVKNEMKDATLTAKDVYRMNKDSVFSIYCDGENQYSTGTGFIPMPGVVLTSAHVVVMKNKEGKLIIPSRILGRFDKSKTNINLKLVHYDLDLDIAYLEIPNNIGKPVTVADKYPEKGERCYVMGNQLGRGSISILSGDISDDVRRLGKQNYILISVPVNPGNSGGPLFNSQGKLIGLIKMGEKQSTSMNYAVPNITIGKFIKTIIDKEEKKML